MEFEFSDDRRYVRLRIVGLQSIETITDAFAALLKHPDFDPDQEPDSLRGSGVSRADSGGEARRTGR